MQQTLVLTILGADQTGIVDSLAKTVADHQGNWQESRMARLAGQFAGIVRVTCDDEAVEPLKQALAALSDTGLQISLSQESREEAPAKLTTVELDVLGNDRPGILSEVSRALRAENANIIEMETRLESAPESGHPIFHTLATLTLGQEANPTQLTKALETLSPDIQVSLS